MIMEACLAMMTAGTAAVMDLRSMRVDNGWILFSLIMGLSLRILKYGLSGVGMFLAGAVFPFVLLAGLFYFRMLGPGDIKLLCALGGIMGIHDIGKCILISFLLGAVISLAILISVGGFRRRIRFLIGYFQDYFHTGVLKPYYRRGAALENFHFTVPVFLSVMLYAGGVY